MAQQLNAGIDGEPTAIYLQSELIRAYVDGIVPGASQEQIDCAWSNLLRPYFAHGLYGIERECLVMPGISKRTADVAVTKLHNGRPLKLLFVETKHFHRRNVNEGWEQSYNWNQHLVQLRGYMLRARNHFGIARDMYGIVAVGNRAKFYRMRHTDPNGELQPMDPDDPSYHLQADSVQIENLLIEIHGIFENEPNQ